MVACQGTELPPLRFELFVPYKMPAPSGALPVQLKVAWMGTGGAVTGGAVTGGAVTGGAVTGGAVTGGAVTGGAVTGGAVAAWDVVDGELLLLGVPEPDVAKAIPPMAISATTIPVTIGSGLRLKGNP
jgi:hypothetical protein